MNESYLKQEILEQPAVLRGLIEQERNKIERLARLIRDYKPTYIMLVARGSSDNAARYGQYLFGTANQMPVALATPSLYTVYGKPPRMDGALVLAISQSGQSPDIVAVIKEGRKQGALTIAITNDTDSPLAHAAQHTINLRAGTEHSVAATKTYTASLMAIALLSTAMTGDDDRWQPLLDVPDQLETITAQHETIIKAAEHYRSMDACVVISRGYHYATAYEIALKLKELTYILAEPYSTADFKHGPVALVAQGFPVLAVVPEGALMEELTDFLGELKERGAELIVISAYERALSLAQTPLKIPAGIPEWVSPIAAVVPGQLLALGLTLAKGYNIDQPRNIHKVTKTE